MNLNYIELIFWNNFLIPKLIIILISTILICVLFKILTKDIHPHGFEFNDLKSDNQLVTWICVTLYIFIFILAIAVLRLYRKDLSLDLKPIYTFFKFAWTNHDYLFIIIILVSCILYMLLFVIILKYIKSFLEIHLLKLHIVLWYDKKDYIAWTVPPYDRISVTSRYKEIVYWFKLISFDKLETKISCFFIKIGLYFKQRLYIFILIDKFLDLFENFVRNSLNIKYNIFLIPMLVLYDCYFNNFVLTTLFQFLPYYFVYTIWYKLSIFYIEANFHMDNIIHELYYDSPKVMYLGLDNDDKIRLDLYIRFGLKIPAKPNSKDSVYHATYHIETGSHAFRIEHYCRYELVDEVEQIYYNKHTNDRLRKQPYDK
jgi:hypothetical protein